MIVSATVSRGPQICLVGAVKIHRVGIKIDGHDVSRAKSGAVFAGGHRWFGDADANDRLGGL